MPLRPVPLVPDTAPLPPAVAAFLADGRARIDAHHRRRGHAPGTGSIPSDHEAVYRHLVALHAAEPGLRRCLEWGSGFGVVTGLAAGLGFDAYGIELDADLLPQARALLAAHGLRAGFAQGSFVPDGYEPPPDLLDLDTRTVLDAADAYTAMDLAFDDFDLHFAFPWPGEEPLYRHLFATAADTGAVLLLYLADEGVQAHRKVGGRRR